MTPIHRRPAGFTLLEVLIAIALMAVLAVLGWRGLDSILITRERLTRSSDDLKALSVCFTQLEEDLRRAWPVRLLNLPAPPIGFAIAGPGDASAPLMLLREPPAGMMAGTVQRVSYRLRAGVLERGFAPWSAVATEGMPAQSAEALTCLAWVDGTEIDYARQGFNAQFQFRNPNVAAHRDRQSH